MHNNQYAQRLPCGLTARDMDVLCLMAECPTKQIARRLGMAVQTVKNHTSAIYETLDVPDRTAAVLYAIKQGRITRY